MTERKAIVRPHEIVAECPINCVCTHKMEGSKAWRRCGHYEGTVLDRAGKRVVCSYNE